MSSPIVRRLYMHNQLLGAAQSMLHQASTANEFNNAMGCILFCALAIEAALNHVGAETFPVWDQHLKRRLSPEGKLLLIASQSNQVIDFGQSPFAAFRLLFQLRNRLAHGVTQDLSYDSPEYWLVYGNHRWPAAKWESMCNSKAAAELLNDTLSIVRKLFAMSGVEEVPRFLLSAHVESDA